MSKFLCHCKEVIRISGSIPNPDEWLLISDVVYDQFHPTFRTSTPKLEELTLLNAGERH